MCNTWYLCFITRTSYSVESADCPLFMGLAKKSVKYAAVPSKSGLTNCTIAWYSRRLFCIAVPVKIILHRVEMLLSAVATADFSFFSVCPSSQTTSSGPGSTREHVITTRSSTLILGLVLSVRIRYISYPITMTPPLSIQLHSTPVREGLSLLFTISYTLTTEDVGSHSLNSLIQLKMVLTGQTTSTRST